MVLGRVYFHIENAGMGGMGWGWDGKGRDVMGWEWYHVEKYEKQNRLFPEIHTRASLWLPFGFGGPACGALGALVCVPFCHLGGYWCPLEPKLQKDMKIKQK